MHLIQSPEYRQIFAEWAFPDGRAAIARIPIKVVDILPWAKPVQAPAAVVI
jgi:hypothetical protein